MDEIKHEAFNFPRLMLITQREMMVPFAQVLEAALQDGARLIQLREKDIGERSLLNLAMPTSRICWRFGVHLIINGSTSVARKCGAQGVQLPFLSLRPESNLLVGASVHSPEEARQAQEIGASYLILGSIFPTASHPGAQPLGLQVLEEVARAVKIPVFAIGGITSQNARACLDAGAHGVAAIRAAWDAEERRELLRIVGEF